MTCMVLVFMTLVEYAVILRKMVIYKRMTEMPGKRALAEGTIGLAKALFPELREENNEEVRIVSDVLMNINKNFQNYYQEMTVDQVLEKEQVMNYKGS